MPTVCEVNIPILRKPRVIADPIRFDTNGQTVDRVNPSSKNNLFRHLNATGTSVVWTCSTFRPFAQLKHSSLAQPEFKERLGESNRETGRVD
jgi:hypothetical protein